MGFKTIKELYSNSVKAHGDRNALSTLGGESLTYNDMQQRIDGMVELLSNAGLERGDKVAILSSNMPNWGVSYFSIVGSGLVAVPILPDFSMDEVASIMAHSEAKALVVSDKQYQKISKDTIKSLNLVVRAATLTPLSRNNQTPTDLTAEPLPEDLAAIIYTSGTTSRPKGVMHSHKGLCRQVELLLSIQDINENDAMLSILPLSHTYESSLGLLYPMSSGASVTYLDKLPTSSVLVNALKVVRPTIMLIVPLIIEKIYRSQVSARFNKNKFMSALYSFAPIRKMLHRIVGKRLIEVFGGRIRFLAIGGAKLDPVVERFLLEGRFPYGIGYGLTETAPLVAGANPQMVKWESTGPVLKDVEYRLDNVHPVSGEGELVVKTPAIMLGYYKNEEATREVLSEDGWFRTKDLCTLDKDGNVYIKGRLGNMILGPSGENIYPEEIEHVLNAHKLVSESLVKEDDGKLIALVHFDSDELERRYQEMKDEFESKIEEAKRELLQYANSKLNKFSRLSNVEELDNEFEKTPTHKIKRFLYVDNNKKKK